MRRLFGGWVVLISSFFGGALASGQPLYLSGPPADAIMDGLAEGNVAPRGDTAGNERWRFAEVFCTVGFAAIVCRFEQEGQEHYVQGAPAEAIARGIVGPFSTLYNIYVDDLDCMRGPGVPSTCSFVRD